MNKTPSKHSTQFNISAPAAQTVYLAGAFNDWKSDATLMKKNGQGTWTWNIELPPGRHEYKFVIDGQWCCDPGCDRPYDGCPKCVSNSFGTMNRVMEVA